MKKKIFLVIPTLGSGGAENLVTNMALKLEKELFSVKIVCLYDENTCKEDYLAKLQQHGIEVLFLYKKSGFDIGIIFKLHNLIRKDKPDILHSHLYAGPYVFFASMLCRKKFIHTVHTMADLELPRIHQKVMAKAYKYKIAVPVAISKAVCGSLEQVYGADIAKVELIYNGVELPESVSVIRKEEDAIKLITVGRLSKEKNTEFMIDAFSKIASKYENLTFDILGEGELKDSLQQKINSYGLQERVRLLGFVSDVRKELQNADIFIFSSHYEGFGLVLVEAMSEGLPVVTSDVCALPEIVRDGVDGYLYPAGNMQDFLEKLEMLIIDAEKRNSFGANAKIQSSKFGLNMTMQKYQELYLRF